MEFHGLRLPDARLDFCMERHTPFRAFDGAVNLSFRVDRDPERIVVPFMPCGNNLREPLFGRTVEQELDARVERGAGKRVELIGQ